MAAAKVPHRDWDLTHDPEARPLGCNGKYGDSGRCSHMYRGTPVCDDCKASSNHYRRERQRGQNKPRVLKPCGTPAAALRHRRKGEELCFECKVAEAAARYEGNKARRLAA